jgi:hypothetical protein
MNSAPSHQVHHAWRIWENPIFRRYCRSRLRPQGLGVSLLIIVLICGFIVGITRSSGIRMGAPPESAARSAIIGLLVVQGLVLFLLGTAQSAGGMVAERDEEVIDYQRLVPMTPLGKVLGYLFGLPVREYVMFLATLPFTAWCLWVGDVGFETWSRLYLVVLTSALTYHLTGMVTGTVVKNRRWAFLVSMAIVFALYTVIPQLAQFGLVFFKYLTIRPVFDEILPAILPRNAGSLVKTVQNLYPTVKFFGLGFPEVVFTVFSQAGLIITFFAMLLRRWKRADSHLLSKPWAVCFYVWLQVLLLGNALPLIDPGEIFPSQGARRYLRGMFEGPPPGEALAMCGMYGFMSLIFVLLFASIITPNNDQQLRGWRRSRKHGRSSLPWLADAASSYGYILVMVLAGAFGWFIFTRSIVESRWFPGQFLGTEALGYFIAVLAAPAIAYQTLLEARGAKPVFLSIVFIGVVPIMAGAILGPIDDRLIPAAVWLAGISPATTPFYAVGSLLPMAELPAEAARAVPRAFQFWLFVSGLAALRFSWNLWKTRRAMAAKVLSGTNLSE